MTSRWIERWERDHLRVSVMLVLGVALASSVTGLGNRFAYDDIPIIVENQMVTTLHTPSEYLAASYWGRARGNALYRPLTVTAFALEWAAGNGSPFPFHLANVVLYALASLAVLAFLRVLLTKGAALTAAIAWAAHPVHVEAVANVVGQSEMLTAIPILIAVTAYIRDRMAGALRARTVVLISVCSAFALLAKEHGVLLPLLLLMMEAALHGSLFVLDVDGRARSRLLARVLVYEVVVYLAVRFAVLQGFAGDTPHPSLVGLSMVQRLWVMLALVPEFARLFWWPAALFADYSPLAVPVLSSPGLGHVAGAAWLLLALALFVYSWRRDRIVACALLFVAMAVAPISNILVATGVLIAERTLFLPSVGIVLLAGRLFQRVWPPLLAFPTPWVRIAVPAVVGIVLVAAVARSADRQLVWADNPTLFATTAGDAPNNYRIQLALGETFGARGAWKRAEQHLRTSDSLFPGHDLTALSLARVLQFDDRCTEALPLYDAVLTKRPDAETAAIGRTACLLESQRLSEARDEALRGRGRGQSPSVFGPLLQLAESSLVATDTVDARNRWFRAGRPVSKTGARLRVPVLFVRPARSGAPRITPQP